MLHHHARCVFSHLCCNGHSLLLGSYLSRIDRIENPSGSACRHSSQDTYHLILDGPATNSLRRSFFGDSNLVITCGPGPGKKRLKIDCVKLTALIENERKVLVVMKQLNRPNQPQGSAGIGKCKLIGNANPVGHCLLCRL